MVGKVGALIAGLVFCWVVWLLGLAAIAWLVHLSWYAAQLGWRAV